MQTGRESDQMSELTLESEDVFALVLGVSLHEGDECPVGLIEDAPVVLLPISQYGEEVLDVRGSLFGQKGHLREHVGITREREREERDEFKVTRVTRVDSLWVF